MVEGQLGIAADKRRALGNLAAEEGPTLTRAFANLQLGKNKGRITTFSLEESDSESSHRTARSRSLSSGREDRRPRHVPPARQRDVSRTKSPEDHHRPRRPS